MRNQGSGIGVRGSGIKAAGPRPPVSTLVLGIDPGLRHTGWGVIKQSGSTLSFMGCGAISSDTKDALAVRLCALAQGINGVIERFRPDTAAIEETFVSVNGASTLKLGQARGAVLLTLAQASLPVAEYAPTLIKKSIVGAGRAEKHQVAQMVRMLLPGCAESGADAMDALAIAITHAHHVTSASHYKVANA